MHSMKSSTKLFLLLVALGLLSLLAGLYVQWLWFESVNYASVFVTILSNQILLYLFLFVVSFLLFYANLRFTRRRLGEMEPEDIDEGREVIYLDQTPFSPWRELLKGPMGKWLLVGLSVFGALLVSAAGNGKWLTVQQFLHQVPVGLTDPIFNKDLGFYFFSLKFYHDVYAILMLTLVLVTIMVGLIYALNASADLLLGDWRQFTTAKSHMAILIALILMVKAWGYRLDAYGILFSPTGIVWGATYADVHASLPAYKTLIVVSLVVALIILANLWIKKINWIAISLGAWLVIAVVMGSVYPSLMQKLVVQPNEFNRETPYIQNAIKYTRSAYALDKAEIKPFTNTYTLDINKAENHGIVSNIRLWDWQPLMVTFQNLQQLRSYYVFHDVDVDRYTINGAYRQVMVAAREIDQNQLPDNAKTWINQTLMYTHGYGILMSPVTEIAQEGFPRFFIQDVPPRTEEGIVISRPEIYFGERTHNTVIVNTKQPEFDYPMGEKNMYATYEGQNGIKIGSWPRRLVLSWVMKDYKMVLSSDITSSSQILMGRQINERVRTIAPYLQFDNDPYIVLNEDGKLYWILDAYTFTHYYPYSEPYPGGNGNNYIRNAVKVTCDAYTGEMRFYIADAEDPIIKTYAAIFPGVYQPLEEMPAGLISHVRYPEDLFKAQAAMYRNFHMLDPNVFYNKEDPWLIPKEVVGDQQVEMEPYYIIMRFPDEEKPEYVLMMPFTPKNRPNMIGWMAARMDGGNYGKLLVYEFNKQETIFGPEQLEARITQDTVISQQLTLWDQRGSRVYRGNLIVIPFDNAVLYVEPIYLQAENSQLPELKRVIVAFGNSIVMETSLDKALLRLFGNQTGPPDQPSVAPTEPQPASQDTVQNLARQAREFYDLAQQRLQAGDWAGYGESLNKLNEVIKRIEDFTKQ